MRQLYYAYRTLLRERGINLIKITSLTLGLFIGILLFARVAFELRYNTSYEDSGKLAVIQAVYTMEGMSNHPMAVIFGPVAATIMEEFPEQVESATVVQNRWNNTFFLGEQRHVGSMMLGDTLFFKTMGIQVTSGQVNELAAPDMVFISDDLAKRIFNTADVIGKTLMREKSHEVTIRGTFKALPKNNDYRPDVVLSFATHTARNWGYFGWGGGDSYSGFVRLKEKADLDVINSRIDAVIEKYMPFQPEVDGWGVKYHLENISAAHTNNPNVKRFVMILTFLAFAILLIAAFNYVLIAISSLSRRAKGVGTHKCSGAGNGQVMRMFLWETGIITLTSLLLVGTLAYNLKELIQELLEVGLEDLFILNTVWVPVCVVLLVFILAGILPGRIFSRIPVTQVFRRYTERNSFWKRGLLFVQFAGVTFVLGILVVVFIQHRQMMDHELGYNPQRIAYAYARSENREVFKATVANLPMVEAVAFSSDPMSSGYSGSFVYGDTDKQVFTTRYSYMDAGFVPLHQIKITEGRNVIAAGEVLVNQTYVDKMPWTDSPLGKKSSGMGQEFGTVVGVMADFAGSNIGSEKQPVLFAYSTDYSGVASVKLKEPFAESLMALNRSMEEVYPNQDVVFSSLEKRINDKYISVRRFRDSVGIAFIAILLITLMGLVGYINDEMQRRSKEIAIRKVNGAEGYNILRLFSREITWVALPAIVISAFLSYLVGREWLEQFGGVKADLSIGLYLLLSVAMLVIIWICVIIKVWRVANENPVDSIKSE